MRLIIIAYAAFIVLGMPDGLLGIAWPSLRHTFQLPLDALGLLLGASTVGFLLVSITSGYLSTKMGVGAFLLAGSAIRFVGLMGYALTPTWYALIIIGFATGLGSGAIDAGINIYFAHNHSPKLMNWLHAMFGIGATISPILLTTLFSLGYSWRWGYAFVSICQGLVVLGFIFTLKQWQLKRPPSAQSSFAKPKLTSTLKLPLVWLSIAIFFIYSGTEITAGQWSFSLFTQSRSVPVSTAGLWISIYWGSFTLGRILFGFIADNFSITNMLRVNFSGVIVGAGILWWNPVDGAGFLGLALIGFALAPIFPLMISDTPNRLGERHAANAIGFQIGAAGVGVAILPSLAGVLADNTSLEIIGPFLMGTAIFMLILYEALLIPRFATPLN